MNQRTFHLCTKLWLCQAVSFHTCPAHITTNWIFTISLISTMFSKRMYLQPCFKQVLGEPWPDPCWPTDACSTWGQAVPTENKRWTCNIGSSPVSCWVPRAPCPAPATGRTTNQTAQVHRTACLISQCFYSAERHLGPWRQSQAHCHIRRQECCSK